MTQIQTIYKGNWMFVKTWKIFFHYSPPFCPKSVVHYSPIILEYLSCFHLLQIIFTSGPNLRILSWLPASSSLLDPTGIRDQSKYFQPNYSWMPNKHPHPPPPLPLVTFWFVFQPPLLIWTPRLLIVPNICILIFTEINDLNINIPILKFQ